MESRLGSAGRSMRKGRDNEQSLDEYRHSKLLPHINQQYEFRITNRLLLQKILNPRRDRTIVQSLSRTAMQLCIRKKKTQAFQNAHLPIGRKPNSQFHEPNSSSIHQNRDKPRASLGLHKNISNSKFHKQSPCIPDPVCEILQNSSGENMQETTWGQTQTSSLRDNFVGKIVRNKTSRIIRNQFRQIQNNIHNNIHGELSQSLFTESQQSYQPIKNKPREVKIKRIVRGYQKENKDQQLFETFTVF